MNHLCYQLSLVLILSFLTRGALAGEYYYNDNNEDDVTQTKNNYFEFQIPFFDVSLIFNDKPDGAENALDMLKKLNLDCFKMYGHYCGPGWCANKWINGCMGSSSQCDFSMHPIDSVDNCCRNHDSCCSKNKGNCAHCDAEFVQCLKRKSTCKDTDIVCRLARSAMIKVFEARKGLGCC
jgi:hypothetical protein